MGLLEKAGQIEGDKTSAEKPKVAEPERLKRHQNPLLSLSLSRPRRKRGVEGRRPGNQGRRR
ncbi:MAG: hypothetical protein Ct9H90mP24_1260 [Methanobacteriota archaeon]|nr:MAG: hypothetical protein Ct9H90mP24_1260 [Euryarchaeota archaeon]